ncbi:histidine kinase N-terminal domain-containing protein [Bacillus sp. 31A1R]|uniref:histidine kinase n=2 Tax=Robertmurraya mangrovi TaxID=3098077 RepID=A0ABU5ISM5_9BACI|nr:histidine kinase N-terminal domain-containing protein [Bacillus sp. 31A1R]MDZ5470152.1 histidine kinase N-terminal domain-containing protein [Bacillus sp. 31A1R]
MNERLIDFLAGCKEELLDKWERQILVSPIDPYKDKIKENGAGMFEIFLHGFYKNNDELEKYIKDIAQSIAVERVNAKINIGDFVYNVNVGRSTVFEFLLSTDLDKTELQHFIQKINFCFDKFLYYAVSRYTEEKNKIIEEKTHFIDSTHKDRLTLLGQMTSSFIHEFRNPLTSVQGFIQLLKSEDPSIKYLDIISNELEQLNFRISQFLLLSKKELIGKEKVIFSLNELIDEVLIFLYPSILDCKVKVLKNIVDNIEIIGYADEIRQVLINIIFNAIDVLSQYRNDPIIEISGTIQEKSISLKISNNGPVIPNDLLQTIFEPFVTTKTLGTGLGLFVCREIIKKHKGTLTCESTEEKTIFNIVLPLS